KVFLGSLNLDPRSILWNTEVGVLIDSPEVASEVHSLTLEGTSPTLSYEVRLVEHEGGKRMIWIAEDEGQQRVLTREPGGAWRRFNAWLSRVIGLESMLYRAVCRVAAATIPGPYGIPAKLADQTDVNVQIIT